MAAVKPSKIDKFNGSVLSRDPALAHYLCFEDFLECSEENVNPQSAAELNRYLTLFKQTLNGPARLWIEGCVFNSRRDIKKQFLDRFSENKSSFGLNNDFTSFQYNTDKTPTDNYEKLQKLAIQLSIGDGPARQKFLSILPKACQQVVALSVNDTTPITEILNKVQCFFDVHANNATHKEVTFYASNDIHTLQNEMSNLKLQLASCKQENDDIPQSKHAYERSRSPSAHQSSLGNKSPYGNRSPYRSNSDRSPTCSDSNGRHGHVIFCKYCLKPYQDWQDCRLRQQHLQDRDLDFQNNLHGFPSNNSTYTVSLPVTTRTTGKVQLNSLNYCKGHFPDSTSAIVLIDSGSPTTLLSSLSFNNSHYLRGLQCQPFPKPFNLNLGNGETITSTKSVSISITIQDQTFIITACVVNNLVGLITQIAYHPRLILKQQLIHT
ncbi:hypothetical protein LOTGIDRAFT_176842 [Lottia gigantea]|uniref:Uncharacterized protein n=1 Tax=Lottia gigantea TaxID=225164 RepID=V4A4F6_LOTGI|nr:hypothetical protein LOTGIDRAFT_176842 [Lottia gigantea]ESO89835.1 hypothetical protein LOTGIDRAFT_176842 [Lottia gigantea]